jgi:hypothetical protein
MSDEVTVLSTFKKLYFQGRLSEAIEFANRNWVVLVNSDIALILLGHIRQEAITQRNLVLANDLVKSIQRLSASVHQSLVKSILSEEKYSGRRRLEKYGFSSASQNEEDGILVEIFNRIGTKSKLFFEFGAGNGLQNCSLYFLLAGWHGAWVEVNKPKYEFIKQRFSFYISNTILKVSDKVVSPENVNDIARELDVYDDLDLLSIDVDGNDYFIFESVDFRPRVIVVEYNGLFPPPHRIVQAYDPDYVYDPATYIGASLQSLSDLADRKGYRLVATNLSGLNAFFVRDDLWSSDLFSDANPSELFNSPRHQLAWGGAFGSAPGVAISPLHGDGGKLF